MDLQLNWWAAGTHRGPGVGAVRPVLTGRAMNCYVVTACRGRSATHPWDGGSRHADRRLVRMSLNYQIQILP